jgi:hypothetical protein
MFGLSEQQTQKRRFDFDEIAEKVVRFFV